MIGWVTQLAPLEVQPKGGLTGQPVGAILDQVDTTAWVVGDPVEITLTEDQIVVLGRRATP